MRKAYQRYKYSSKDWIGEIPESWDILRTKYIYDEVKELSENGNEILLSVSEYTGVTPRNTVIDEGDHLTRADSLIGYRKCNRDDLVMNIMLAWKRGLGVSQHDGIVSPAYSVFRNKPEKSCPAYLHYLLRTDLYTAEFRRNSTGVIDSRLRLYPDEFMRIYLLSPPLPEQQSIGYFLDHKTKQIDTLIEKKQKMIELLKEQRIAIISHAVTKGLNPDVKMKDSGIEWIGEIPEHWELKRLKYNLRLIADRANSDDKYKKIALENIQSWTGKYIETTSEFEAEGIIFREKDVLFGKLRPYLAKVFQAPFDGRAIGDFFVYRPQNNIDSRFAFYKLLSRDYIDVINSSTYGAKMPRVSYEFMNNLPFVYPNIEEQRLTSEFLDKKANETENLIQKEEISIKLLQEYRTALISEVVTGKIDVRDEVTV